MGDSVSGGCLCGAVRFRVDLPTRFCAHCHCSMCRRNHGAAYVTWFGSARDGLAIESGRDSLVRYPSSEHGTRSFCGRCGTSLFCESTRRPDEVDVVLASLDGPIDRAPAAHVFFDSRAAWTDVRDELPRLGGDSGTLPLAGEAPASRPGVSVGHVALGATDVEESAAFFASLGMRAIHVGHEIAILELRGGTHLVIFPGDPVSPGSPAPFDLMVDDLEQAHASFAAAGLAPSAIEKGSVHRAFTLAAPSGHAVVVNSSHVSGRAV